MNAISILILLCILFIIGTGLYLIYSNLSDSNTPLKKIIKIHFMIFIPMLVMTTLALTIPKDGYAIERNQEKNDIILKTLKK